MAHLQSRSRRWTTATRWPLGIVLAGWRYMWSTTPVHRSEMGGSWPEDAPPDLPRDDGQGPLQRLSDGAGPLTHRTYRTRIVGSALDPEELMGRVTADLDRVAPSEFASFQRVGEDDGHEGLEVGDEYVVRMPGPWDGPVRTVATEATYFRLATLPGHLEAGQIEFRVRGDYRSLWFEIESWARSGDRTSDLLYDRLGFSKEVQLHMWSSVLREVVKLADGRIEGGLVITTRRVPEEELPDSDGEERTEGPHGPDREELAELVGREVNIDPEKVMDPAPGAGWHQDDLIEPLPSEPSGPPVEGGSWQLARRLIDDYQLADPKVVTATYDPAAPLEGRDMLLRISFHGLRFRVGVRVGRVFDEERRIEGRPVQVFGWSYDTLEGHFEEGRMFYELWKWLETGDVEFRLHSVSRPARGGSPIIRFGLRLFGRAQQLHFYHQICRRVRQLTETGLETERIAALAAED